MIFTVFTVISWPFSDFPRPNAHIFTVHGFKKKSNTFTIHEFHESQQVHTLPYVVPKKNLTTLDVEASTDKFFSHPDTIPIDVETVRVATYSQHYVP